MSGTPEGIAASSKQLQTLKQNVLEQAQNSPDSIERLIHLEQAFYIWHGYYHWLHDTSFEYFVLEKTIKELFQGRFSLPLTASRKKSFANKPDGTLRRFYNDQQTAYIPTPKEIEEFLQDLEVVKKHALKVSTAVQKGNQQALERVVKLEKAFYLFLPRLEYIKSKSPRWKKLKELVAALK